MNRDVAEPSHPGGSRSRPGWKEQVWLTGRIFEIFETSGIFETHRHDSLLLLTECFRMLDCAETSYHVLLHRSWRPPGDYLS